MRPVKKRLLDQVREKIRLIATESSKKEQGIHPRQKVRWDRYGSWKGVCLEKPSITPTEPVVGLRTPRTYSHTSNSESKA